MLKRSYEDLDVEIIPGVKLKKLEYEISLLSQKTVCELNHSVWRSTLEERFGIKLDMIEFLTQWGAEQVRQGRDVVPKPVGQGNAKLIINYLANLDDVRYKIRDFYHQLEMAVENLATHLPTVFEEG